MHEILSLLNQISDELNTDLDLDKILQRIISLTVKYLKATGGSVILFDDMNRVSHYILQKSDISPEQAKLIMGKVLSDGFAGWVLKHGQGDIISDTKTDPRWLTYFNQPYRARSVIASPIRRRNNVLGIITINHASEPNFFHPEDLSLLNAISGQAAIALENARLFQEKEQESAMLSAIINSTQDAILVTNHERQHVIFANPAAETALKITTDWQNKPLEEVTPVRKIVELIATSGNTDKGLELPDGRSMLVSMVEIPQVGTLTLLHDISALKTLDKMKSEFITTFTHDLSAPLAAIKGQVTLIKMDGSLNEQQAEDLEIIGKAADQMRRLIKDLLELTRLESLKDFFTCDISLEEMVESTYHTFKPVASAKNITLQYSVAKENIRTHGNPTLISRAIDNLVENAIKYTRPSGTVSVAVKTDDTTASISVQDTGIGIANADTPMIFDKFYRAHAPTENEIPGSGLGLSIVKTIVERHGGKIQLDSQLNIGSTFTISLPLVSSNN